MARRRPPIPPTIRLPRRWRRHGGVLCTVLALLLLVVCQRVGLGPAPEPPQAVQPNSLNPADSALYHDRSFRVIHVVDGDTIDIDVADPGAGKPKTRIRLWGVDCPEVQRPGQPGMFYGPEASEFARQTLDQRDVHVVLSQRQTRDRYGRLLAYVFLEPGGPLFNELLIEQGYCYADPRWDHHYESRFLAAERRAKSDKAGLWQTITPDEMPKWRQKREAKLSQGG